MSGLLTIWVLAYIGSDLCRRADGPHAALFRAIAYVESKCDPRAVGDDGRSRGMYQIGRAYWQDACEYGGLDWEYDALVWSRPHCERIMLWYWKRYGARNDEERARLHNGGPNWRKKPATVDYWRRVKGAM